MSESLSLYPPSILAFIGSTLVLDASYCYIANLHFFVLLFCAFLRFLFAPFCEKRFYKGGLFVYKMKFLRFIAIL